MEQSFAGELMNNDEVTIMQNLGIVLMLMISVLVFEGCTSGDTKRKQENFQNQLGTYVLDLKRTDLGVYRIDSILYKNLKITFRNDSTFHFNMKVPFIYDSVGTWKAAGQGVE